MASRKIYTIFMTPLTIFIIISSVFSPLTYVWAQEKIDAPSTSGAPSTSSGAGGGSLPKVGEQAGQFFQSLRGGLSGVLAVPTLNLATLLGDIPTKIQKWILDDIFKTMLAALKKRLLDMIVDQIVQWVQGGGEPKFITNWHEFLQDAMGAAAGDFVKSLDLGFLCEPFRAKVKLALLPVKKFSQRAQCTLDKITGNIKDFVNDFRKGGWIAYSESFKPQNNYFGAVLMSVAELEDRKISAAGAAWSEGIAGGGFLSVKKCKRPLPAGVIEESGAIGQGASSSACAEWEITTPGRTVGDAVARAVGSDIDYIVNADELSDYVASIVNAFINRLIMSGVAGLRGLGTKNSPKGGSISTPPIKGATPSQTGGAGGTGGAGEGGGGGGGGTVSSSVQEAYNNYGQTRDNHFAFTQSGLVQQIDYTLQPLLEAEGILKQTISILEDYNKSAQDIYDELAKLDVATCRSATQFFGQQQQFDRKMLMTEIINSITQEQGTVNSLNKELTDGRNTINKLQDAKNKMLSLNSAADNDELLKTYNSIVPDLDPLGAMSYKTDKQTQQSDIAARTADNLQKFNEKLTICKNTQK